MAHIIKDLFTGSVLAMMGLVFIFIALIVMFFFWIFLKICSVFICAAFFVFAVISSVWLIGYLFRKARE